MTDALHTLFAIFGVIALLAFLACLTVIPWALGIAQIWGSFFG